MVSVLPLITTASPVALGLKKLESKIIALPPDGAEIIKSVCN